jgi:hypothetical protein
MMYVDNLIVGYIAVPRPALAGALAARSAVSLAHAAETFVAASPIGRAPRQTASLRTRHEADRKHGHVEPCSGGFGYCIRRRGADRRRSRPAHGPLLQTSPLLLGRTGRLF